MYGNKYGRLYPIGRQKTKGGGGFSQNFYQRKKEEMLTLPKRIRQVLRQFETVLSERVWEWAKVLVRGAILAPGERTVAAILRGMGCSDEKQFQNSHRVLNRATWSSRELSRLVLGLLVRLFVPGNEPLLLGIDETIERRRGRQIAARGVYRDPVRSSKEFFVKTTGLRWMSLMRLPPIPWSCRVWALPFLSVLAPSERYHEERKMRHKTKLFRVDPKKMERSAGQGTGGKD